MWYTRKAASQAATSCQPRASAVHLTLPISRRMVAMAATQGVYRAQKARKARAAAGEKVDYITAPAAA